MDTPIFALMAMRKCKKLLKIFSGCLPGHNVSTISVLPVLSKVIERVVHQQLYDYLEKNKLLSRRQFGFRKGTSTQHAVTLCSDAIRKNMDKGLMTGAVLIDLSKAFDTLDHARLLSKLSIYGIKDRELFGLVVICLTESNLLYVMDRTLKCSLQPVGYHRDQSLVL